MFGVPVVFDEFLYTVCNTIDCIEIERVYGETVYHIIVGSSDICVTYNESLYVITLDDEEHNLEAEETKSVYEAQMIVDERLGMLFE